MSAYETPAHARETFEAMIAAAGPEIDAVYKEAARDLPSACAKAMQDAGMLASVKIFDAAVKGVAASGLSDGDVRRALIARFAVDLPDRVETMAIPPSIVALYPELTERLAKNISVEDPQYDVDAYARDIAHVMGLFLPAVSQDIDLHSHLDFKMFLVGAVKKGQIGLLSKYVANRLWGRCYDIHTDSRNTARFDQDGWNGCYHRMADLMKLRPEAAGFFGTSWFYDPALLSISPRLAYLQEVPREGGAFFLWNGPGQVHTERATLTSKTRRARYEAGEYLPTCYTMVWPRRALLDWSARTPR